MAALRDYTVGLVCVLQIELIAVAAMLDEKYQDHPKSSVNNHYIQGRVGKHNVVATCGSIDDDIFGYSEAIIASQMAFNFPSIKFCLMIGIGGGVPESVRLGDVVVSTPIDELAGIVRWDLDEEGSVKYKNALNRPPIELLTALTRLRSEHELNGSMIPLFLEDLDTSQSILAWNYPKLESLRDVLFQADYQHIDNPTTGDANAEEIKEGDHCSHCDQTKIVHRKPRDMRVHYGLIASSDQVIKHALTRDKINTRLGGKVLCFETEAAWLVDDSPCLVIREICNYADSHGNDDWQKYAAYIAGAFAKELLLYVPAQEVEQMPTIQGELPSIS